ncbi:MAG TPA: magnesium transporter CorA family protein [Stellaceae bacterium]|nr:magnesium transporter CorA family protein [Stellaceae bacterium]
MITIYTRDGGTVAASGDLTAIPANSVWFDLEGPTSEEIELVGRLTGITVPTFAMLSEIESSSRLRVEDGAIYLSAPLIHRATQEMPQATPVGFVLTHQVLITVRFEPLTAFSDFIQRLRRPDSECGNGMVVFTELMEAIVDRLADVLENIAASLDELSHRLFRVDPAGPRSRRRPAHDEAYLRDSLKRVGRSGDLISKIRDSLLSIARIVPFAANHGNDWSRPEVKADLDTLRQDVISLSDYDMHLANKVQLLLDATLGLINIEQNNIIKVLTIVSVVGVPPTLVASMYGMNFKLMPELEWAWGYPYALTLIVLSAILPILWFKRRGWL